MYLYNIYSTLIILHDVIYVYYVSRNVALYVSCMLYGNPAVTTSHASQEKLLLLIVIIMRRFPIGKLSNERRKLSGMAAIGSIFLRIVQEEQLTE